MQNSKLAPALAALAALAALGLGGCGGGGGGGDDAPGDGPFTIDIDNGSCGDQLNFTGEYVDWDNDTSFCGIFDALFEVQGGGAMDSTAPNGRFEGLCIPRDPVTLLDVTPPAGDSPCATPASPYPMAGIAVANRDVILAGGFFSARAFTSARRDSFFAQAGFSFAPALAQVFVHVHGTPRAVSIAAAHAPTHAVVNRAWVPGDTGADVFFPNVDVGTGSTTLSVAGGAIGTGMIPLVGGKFTYVSVYAR
jgi:hypothetical protein